MPVADGRSTGAADLVHRRLRSAFRTAYERCPDRARSTLHLFAGRLVRIRIVGSPAAHALARPFTHLCVADRPGTPARLTIALWEEAATGVRCEAVGPWRGPARSAVITVAGDGRWVSRRKPGIWTAFDRRRGEIFGWIRRADRLSLHQRSSPLHSELSLWYRDHGIQPIHAGLVALDGDGVLLAGPSGSGKSTAVLSCVREGFRFLADDYTGLAVQDVAAPAEGRYAGLAKYHGIGHAEPHVAGLAYDRSAGPIDEHGTGLAPHHDTAFTDAAARYGGHSLYGSLLLEPGQLDRFPTLRSSVLPVPGRSDRESKSFIPLGALESTPTARVAPIRAIALPRLDGDAHARVRPVRPRDALLSLMPTSLRLVPRRAFRTSLERLTRLTRRVPAFRLDLGPDPAETPTLIHELLTATIPHTD